jgi:1-acyl-sn-glycerol-3-phosphate acyltransferase
MKKFLGYIFTPLQRAFFLVLVIFQPIQWVCFRFFGYSAHKKAVDILNLMPIAHGLFTGQYGNLCQ